MAVEMYCVKCRAKTESNSVQEVILKNGRNAVTALCSACGTKKFRMGKLPVAA